jgi:hypothetical protein
MDYDNVLLNQPVVFDNVCALLLLSILRSREPHANVLTKGSGTIKAGFAGEEQPKTFFPS